MFVQTLHQPFCLLSPRQTSAFRGAWSLIPTSFRDLHKKKFMHLTDVPLPHPPQMVRCYPSLKDKKERKDGERKRGNRKRKKRKKGGREESFIKHLLCTRPCVCWILYINKQIVSHEPSYIANGIIIDIVPWKKHTIQRYWLTCPRSHNWRKPAFKLRVP